MKNFIQFTGPILAVIVCFLLVWMRPQCPDVKPLTSDENKKLQAKIDSLERVNVGLDSVASIYRLQRDSIYAIYRLREEKIKQLKKAQHEKLAAIDSLRSDELYGLFSGFNLNR